MEARVLEAQDVAVLHRRDGRFGDGADAIVGEGDGALETLRAAPPRRARSESFGVALPSGRPKCESRITLPPLSAISATVGASALDAGRRR